MNVRLTLGCAGLAALTAPGALAQASFAISSKYSSGAYGETTDTTLLFIAASAGYAAGR